MRRLTLRRSGLSPLPTRTSPYGNRDAHPHSLFRHAYINLLRPVQVPHLSFPRTSTIVTSRFTALPTMSTVHFAPSTRFLPAERRTLASPPPKARSAPTEVPPVPPLPLQFRVVDPNLPQPGECLLVRGQKHVKPRNRDRREEYRPLIDGGANFQFKLLSLKDAQRRHSIVYRTLPSRA